MSYLELPPSADLARWVHRVWVFESPVAGPAPDRIVPDGRSELIVHYGIPFDELAPDGSTRAQPQVLFAGQLTRPLQLRSPAGAGVVGVRFHAAGARAFVGLNMRQTTDRRLPLDEIQPGLSQRLAAAIATGSGAEARTRMAEQFVRDRIARIASPDDAPVSSTAVRIQANGGRLDIDTLAGEAGIGRRQFERRFAEAVGIGPALFAAIVRFRTVFDLIEHDATRPWTDAALDAGYYDQSHFIREFRRLVGCTPSEFHRASGELATALV